MGRPVFNGISSQVILLLQVNVEASLPAKTKGDQSSLEKAQEVRVIQDSVLERNSLEQNHSTFTGIESEISAPKTAAGSNDVANLSSSSKTNAFLMGDSSDSEGPLPEIDLGLSDEDEIEEES